MQLMVNSGVAKGKLIKITGSRFLIGRGFECQLRPRSDTVGLRHAELRLIAGTVFIRDLGSASGTRLNGQALTGSAPLRAGDIVEIGLLSFTVLLDEALPARRPKSPTEDDIASWVIDDPAAPPPRRPPAPTPRARSSPLGARAQGYELLQTMMTKRS